MTESEAPEIHTEEKPHWSDHLQGVPWHKVFFICLLLGVLIQTLSDTAIVLLAVCPDIPLTLVFITEMSYYGIC